MKVTLRYRPEDQLSSDSSALAAHAPLSEITQEVLQAPSDDIERQERKRKRVSGDTLDSGSETTEPAKKQRPASTKQAASLKDTRWSKDDIVRLVTTLFGPDNNDLYEFFLHNRQGALKKVCKLFLKLLAANNFKRHGRNAFRRGNEP